MKNTIYIYRIPFDLKRRSSDDCAMWLKLYGVESRIYINDEEPCTLGVDCDENGFSIEDDDDYDYDDDYDESTEIPYGENTSTDIDYDTSTEIAIDTNDTDIEVYGTENIDLTERQRRQANRGRRGRAFRLSSKGIY